jgi:flavin-dependent dehydrogenase
MARAGETLPPGSLPLLRALELVSPALKGGHIPSFGNASSWGSSELLDSDFIFNVHGIGHHLDRASFDASLRSVAAQAGVVIATSARVVGTDRLRLRMGHREESLSCRWMVDATGRSATCARARGAARQSEGALVAFHVQFAATRTGTDSDGRTVIEAAPDGWWYTMLLPAGGRTVAFLTDSDLVPPKALLANSHFMARIDGTRHVREIVRSNGYVAAGPVRGSPAASSRLEAFSGPDWLAVGDAALAFDPLSSQGIFNAVYTGMRAGQALNAALCGDREAVNRYGLHLEGIYQAYCRNLRGFYDLETRWPDRPFWQRRQTRSRSIAEALTSHGSELARRSEVLALA